MPIAKTSPTKPETTSAVNNAAPSKSRNRAKRKGGKEDLPILYPEVTVAKLSGDDALTYEQAKEIIGWEEETEGVDFGKSFLTTIDGKKIRTTKNTHNRDFQLPNALMVKQEVLRGRWKFNGETMIIGNRGNVLSAQHRLIGFILAVEEWRKTPKKFPAIKKEPRLECLIVYGISEEDDVVNTIDTGRPRSLADVIFRSAFFSDIPRGDRKEFARAAEFAIRCLWERTGVSRNPYDPDLLRSHAESIDFLRRHSRLLECIRHIMEESDSGKFVGSLGKGAGLMFLMGCSLTDPETYYSSEPPSEKVLNWKLFDKAQDFFVHLAQGHKSLAAIKEAMAKILESGDREKLTQNESEAIVIKAWNIWKTGEAPTVGDLKLSYVTNDDLTKVLDDFPTVGGIDLGRDIYEPVIEGDEEEEEKPETPLQKAQRLRQEKNGKAGSGKPFSAGDIVWVIESNGGSWKGKLLDRVKSGKALVKVSQGFAGAGTTVEVSADKLSHTQPTLASPKNGK